MSEQVIAPYQRVARMLRDQIVGGVYQPGDALPSVRQVMEQEGISKATAEKALRMLRNDGLVETRPGVGVVVRDNKRVNAPRDMFLRTTGLAEDIRLKNEQSEFLHVGYNDAPPKIADALGIAHGAKAVCRQRLIRRSGNTIMFATSWFPYEYGEQAPKILERERIPNGTPKYVAECLGKQLSKGTDEIQSVRVDYDSASALGVAPGSPALMITSQVTATDGTLIEYGGYTMRELHTVSYDYELLAAD